MAFGAGVVVLIYNFGKSGLFILSLLWDLHRELYLIRLLKLRRVIPFISLWHTVSLWGTGVDLTILGNGKWHQLYIYILYSWHYALP